MQPQPQPTTTTPTRQPAPQIAQPTPPFFLQSEVTDADVTDLLDEVLSLRMSGVLMDDGTVAAAAAVAVGVASA